MAFTLILTLTVHFSIVLLVGPLHHQPDSGLPTSPAAEENISGFAGLESLQVGVSIQGGVIQEGFLSCPVIERVPVQAELLKKVGGRHTENCLGAWQPTKKDEQLLKYP